MTTSLTSLPKTMRAAVLTQVGAPLVIQDVPVPEPGRGEVLVQTRACGMCATDLHICAGWGYEPELPFVMGHEPAGVVAALGPDVSGFAIGDRVLPNIFYSCGNCRYCRTNRETLCTQLGGILGVLKHQGAYAEYFKVPARQLFHLPNAISFADGAVIADAVVCAMHAVRRRAQLCAGDWVLVVGVGGVGLSVLQAARAQGAHVIAVDINPDKLTLARQMGACHTLPLNEDNADAFGAQVKALTGGDGEGIDVAFDCFGSSQTLAHSVAALRRNGRLVIVGYTQEPYPLLPQWMSRYELEIVGSRSGGRQDTADAIALVGSGQWHSIVSNTFPLSEINQAMQFLQAGRAKGRVVITMNEQ